MDMNAIDFDSMNETDVREVVVRPILHSLGYKHGTQATIRTEVPLRYDRLFLGRKKESDPKISDLRGRADYICDVVKIGRWVVEVKAPSESLTIDDAHQAHSYAAHPEIAALYYLLTNGREFELFRTSYPSEPILRWRCEETDEKLMLLQNILSPAAITKAVHRKIDTNKPLAVGVGSKMRLVGGYLTYQRYAAETGLLANQLQNLEGQRAIVTGREVARSDEGGIVAVLELAGANTVSDIVNKMGGVNFFEFSSPDEYISNDVERPTVFQGFMDARFPAGATIPKGPNNPETTLPLPVRITAYTNAVGSIAGDKFAGMFTIDHEVELVGAQSVGIMFPKTNIYAEGDFQIVFSD